MKFRYFILLAAALLLSCKGKEEGAEASIAFAQNPLIISCEAGVVDCGLVCTAAWTASSKDGWVTVLTPEGQPGDALKLRVSANSTDVERTASVTVKAGSAGKILQLVQSDSGTSGLVSDAKVSIDTYGKSTYISVNTEKEWTYTEPEESWLTLEKKGPTALGISAEVNFTGEPRSASFSVSSPEEDRTAQVTVTQQFTNEKFLASTPYGRALVYAMGSYVKTVSSDTYTELTDGVICYEITCSFIDGLGGDTEAKKRNIFLFEVDMTKASVLVTLPDDDNANIHNRQRMTAQIPALQNKRTSLTVWGGTNGDFFADEGTPELQGILWRGGTCLKSTFATTVNTVCAVMKDGTARCMNQASYATQKSQIQEALGGRQALLWNGGIVGFSDTAQHPRTAVGTSADGKKLWMMVVDGRQEQYSTGSYSVSYEPLARILKAAGAADAINLDGGGSSTFVVRGADGSFSKHNKPANSGRTEREVLNGLAIVTVK